MDLFRETNDFGVIHYPNSEVKEEYTAFSRMVIIMKTKRGRGNEKETKRDMIRT
jgi:hypothetical protein